MGALRTRAQTPAAENCLFAVGAMAETDAACHGLRDKAGEEELEELAWGKTR